jgi:DNA excision repair protein ERCC-3
MAEVTRYFSKRALDVCRLLKVNPDDVLRNRQAIRRGMILVEEILDHTSMRPPLRHFQGIRRLSVLEVRSDVTMRPYQADAATRAARRNGFIVAPCAAGKTMIGLLVAALNGGRVLILTSRYAEQWYETITRMFHLLGNTTVALLTAVDASHAIPHIVIGTYSSLASPSRSDRQRLVRLMPYETVILDEAHGAASPHNLMMFDRLNYRYIIALTATKVREDNELEKLESRIGSTVVDIDRNALVACGFVADIECIKLVVPRTQLEPALVKGIPSRVLMAIDPTKMQLLKNMLTILSGENHRILVFCDDLFCLKWSRSILNRSCPSIVGTISMKTPEEERRRILAAFSDPKVSTTTLFISRTGDEALDLPTTSAAIVYCNNWGSRRQLVQRLGRLARVGGNKKKSLFAVLIVDDKKEHSITTHRETYAQEHGFSFSVCRHDDTRFAITPSADTSRYVTALVESWRAEHE